MSRVNTISPVMTRPRAASTELILYSSGELDCEDLSALVGATVGITQQNKPFAIAENDLEDESLVDMLDFGSTGSTKEHASAKIILSANAPHQATIPEEWKGPPGALLPRKGSSSSSSSSKPPQPPSPPPRVNPQLVPNFMLDRHEDASSLVEDFKQEEEMVDSVFFTDVAPQERARHIQALVLFAIGAYRADKRTRGEDIKGELWQTYERTNISETAQIMQEAKDFEFDVYARYSGWPSEYSRVFRYELAEYQHDIYKKEGVVINSWNNWLVDGGVAKIDKLEQDWNVIVASALTCASVRGVDPQHILDVSVANFGMHQLLLHVQKKAKGPRTVSWHGAGRVAYLREMICRICGWAETLDFIFRCDDAAVITGYMVDLIRRANQKDWC